MEKSLEEIKAVFKKDIFATKTTGIEILEAKEGYAKVCLKIDSRHKNALGAVMGAVYFTMADFAFAIASNGCAEQPVVTLNSQINYLSAAKTDTLYAESFVQKDGRTAVFYSTEVYELSGGEKRVLTTVQNTGFKLLKR